MRVDAGRVQAVVTNRGEIAAGAVLNATAGWASTISRMAGVTLQIVSHPLQACVTEPLKPFLNKVIVSASLHVYVNQTDKGELVIGAEIDPYQSYSTRDPADAQANGRLKPNSFPQPQRRTRAAARGCGVCVVGDARITRRSLARPPRWPTLYMDVGWGTYGFKAGPSPAMWAELTTRTTPKLLVLFSPVRFRLGSPGSARAAAVSH